MHNHCVDLLVIGAGASGSCIAYEAAKRGLKVALLDAGDIGCGTSCRSTKLLHGGVRYLELAFKTLDLAQLRLVREALYERGHWLEEVPFLAHPMELILPSKNCISQYYYRLGLGMYDTLAGQKNIGHSRILSRQQIKQNLPLLSDEIANGVAYSDGQFDDSRLNLLLALSAEKSGAELYTRYRVVGLEKNRNGEICGAISQNEAGEQERWTTKVIVNATGIHVDTIRRLADENIDSRILVSRGVHIVLEEVLCPKGVGLLLPATDDGRVLFLLPFFGRTQVGTTDSPCEINDANTPSSKEEEYLIDYVKRWFPSLQKPNIKSSWAGGRPLLKPSGSSRHTSQVVREHEIETLPCGLISAMGGKWTTCRQIAFDALKAIEKVLDKHLPEPRYAPIIGSHKDKSKTSESLSNQRKILTSSLPASTLQNNQILHLQSNYGLQAPSIIAKSSQKQREPLSDVIPICEAEIEHAIKNEHAKTSTDILARRCRLAMVDLSEAQRILPIVQKHFHDFGLDISDLDLQQ